MTEDWQSARDVAIVRCDVSVYVLTNMLRRIGAQVTGGHRQEQGRVIVGVGPQREHVLFVPLLALQAKACQLGC